MGIYVVFYWFLLVVMYCKLIKLDKVIIIILGGNYYMYCYDFLKFWNFCGLVLKFL